VLFFIVLTLRFFARRERDATRTADRLRTGNLWRSLASLTPWLAAPVTAIVILAFMVHGGWQGASARKKEHDYWRKNVLTYRDAPSPALAGVDVALDIAPSKRSLKSVGTYKLVNLTDKPLAAIPVTGGLGWKNVTWKMNGAENKPENDPKFLNCQPYGFVREVTNPLPMRISRDGQHLLVRYEEWSLNRPIYLDGRAHPTYATPSLLGHAVGRVENGVLIGVNA